MATALRIPHSALRTPHALLFVGLASLSFRVLLLLIYPFDGLYGQDAYFYLTATEHLVKIWGDPATLRDWLFVWGAPPVSVWPLGYHVQMALASLFTGLNAASGQAVSLIAGTFVPVLTSMLTLAISDFGLPSDESPKSKVQSPKLIGAVFAGLIMGVGALCVRGSLVVMADMAGLFWALLGTLLAVRYLSNSHTRAWVGLLVGLCLGIACITRYIYPLLLPPILFYAIFQSKVQSPKSKVQSPTHNFGLWTLDLGLSKMLPIVVPVAALVGLQLLHNWAHPVGGAVSPVIGEWSLAHVWQSSFETPDGHKAYDWPMGVFFALRPLVWEGALGLALLPFVILGVVGLFQRRAFAQLGLLLGWWLLFAGFYSGSVYQPERFVLSYLPPLAILAGLSIVVSRQSSVVRTKYSRLATGDWRLATVIAVVGLAMAARTAWSDFRGLYEGKQDYLRAVACVRQAVEVNDAPVFAFGLTFTLERYSDVEPIEFFFETPKSVEDRLKSNQSPALAYLVLPAEGFEAQWGHTSMGHAYRYLRENHDLRRRECAHTSFALYEVR